MLTCSAMQYQVIALVAYLVERDVKEPFLIAAPAAVVANWERELDAWLPSLAYVAYKGTADKRTDIFESQVRAHRGLLTTSYGAAVSARHTLPYLLNPGPRNLRSVSPYPSWTVKQDSVRCQIHSACCKRPEFIASHPPLHAQCLLYW